RLGQISTYFNPRTHEECDGFYYQKPLKNQLFQSTHSRGVRHGYVMPNGYGQIFQSTHSRGVRQLKHHVPNRKVNFNPRTHEECDGLGINACATKRYFNPRTHEECDRKCLACVIICENFNPRTHEECDQSTHHVYLLEKIFQSTHSRGVRPCT